MPLICRKNDVDKQHLTVNAVCQSKTMALKVSRLILLTMQPVLHQTVMLFNLILNRWDKICKILFGTMEQLHGFNSKKKIRNREGNIHSK